MKSSPLGLLFQFKAISRTQYGHTKNKGYSPLKFYTDPVIRKPASGQWYIDFNYTVPPELREYYKRGTKRFKKYGDINMYSGAERDQNAIELCADWKFCLKYLDYNPFEEQLNLLGYVLQQENVIRIAEQKIQLEEEKKQEFTEEELRKQTPIIKAFALYLEGKEEIIDNANSMSTYKGTVKWLTEYFEASNRMNDPVGSIRHLEISGAVMLAKKTRDWNNTTYNKEINNAMTVFNWFETQEYMVKNPSNGRIVKAPQKTTRHKWYDRELAILVKKSLLEADCIPVYRACQFTYHLCIRSKKELMLLKVGDIDRVLKRVHFRPEVSKNGEECHRDYPPEFEKVLDEMNFNALPKNFYIMGKKGEPSEFKCHKDFLADLYRPIREKLGISDKHSIYAWKHTRVVHEMMKKADPYAIQHLCRHSSLETTLTYMKDFDINLTYSIKDLTF